jgi:hypothetical protein
LRKHCVIKSDQNACCMASDSVVLSHVEQSSKMTHWKYQKRIKDTGVIV